MRLDAIFVPELATFVKFKRFSPSDMEAFVEDAKHLGAEDYKKHVIETIVYNLRSEVLDSLKMMSKETAERTLSALYNGCLMLNPGLDVEKWVEMSFVGTAALPKGKDLIFPSPSEPKAIEATQVKTPKRKRISKTKYANLEAYLNSVVIGQSEAINIIANSIKRSQAGLSDPTKPIGVFLLAGPSGSGKSYLAKELHKYLFGQTPMARLDCGQLQHKHENQRLIGAASGYVGYEDGGQLTNQIKKNANTVLLLDEAEKAHADIWDTFLHVFDEGYLTDNKGHKVDFSKTIIIMTTNLGNNEVVDLTGSAGVGFAKRDITATPKRDFVVRSAKEAIKKKFRPEFLNRIDEVVVFNHLTDDNYKTIAQLEVDALASRLTSKGLDLIVAPDALQRLAEAARDPISGARGLSKYRRDNVDNQIADEIMLNKPTKGSSVVVDYVDNEFVISTMKAKSQLIRTGD